MLRKTKIHIDYMLLMVIMVGLYLRFFGIEHGFPFIFHPDEPAVVRSALGIRFDPNPGHFDWPHLHFYLNYFLIEVFIKFRGLLQLLSLRDILETLFPILWKDPLVFYLISRSFNALLGALTAIPVYLSARRLFGKKVGVISAFSLMLMPYHAYTSHFALIDIPTAFWASWAMYFSVKIYKESTFKNFLLAGFFVGLAASTKYNGGLMAIMVVTAVLLKYLFPLRKNIPYVDLTKNLFLSGVFAVLGFIVGTPYSVFDFKDFIRTDGPTGALWQFTNVGKVDFATHLSQFFNAITTQYAENFGYVFILMFLLLFVYLIFSRKHKELWLFYIPAFFLFYYVSGFSKDRAHYYLSVYPMVAIASGFLIVSLTKKLRSWQKIIVYLFIFFIPFFFSFQRSLLLYREDTRVLLYNYIKNVGRVEDTYYFTSNDLSMVFEKFTYNRVVKDFKALDHPGYIFVGLDNVEFDNYEMGLHPESYIDKLYTKVKVIRNVDRRGINIIVYRYE